MVDKFISCINNTEYKCVDLVAQARENANAAMAGEVQNDPRQPSEEVPQVADSFTKEPQAGIDLRALLKGIRQTA